MTYCYTTSVPGGRWISQGLEGLQGYQIEIQGPKMGESGWQILFLLAWNCHPLYEWAASEESLKNKTAIQKSNKELECWLTKVDKSDLPGRIKA